MSTQRKTCLHDFNAKRGARFVDFAGWDMPVQFSSILAEHLAVRKSAGMFDVSHMGEFSLRGPDAAQLIDLLITNDASKMTAGRVLYSPMCAPDGTVVDDLLVYKRGDESFLLCVNASNTEKDLAWISEHAAGTNCVIEDESSHWGLIALQGRNSPAILQHLTPARLGELRYYHFAEAPVAGAACIVSRTGYTGETGFEIFCPWGQAAAIAGAIEEAGRGHDLTMCGLGARDGLRLEAGFSLYGHEISDTISPVEAGLNWTVKLKKETSFIGRDALLKQTEEGTANRVVFFRTGDRRIIRSDTEVSADGAPTGRVLSGTLSPVLNEAIGSALIQTAHLDSELSVDVRGKKVILQRVSPPFVPLDKA
jgi:aminomethyltransferase